MQIFDLKIWLSPERLFLPLRQSKFNWSNISCFCTLSPQMFLKHIFLQYILIIKCKIKCNCRVLRKMATTKIRFFWTSRYLNHFWFCFHQKISENVYFNVKPLVQTPSTPPPHTPTRQNLNLAPLLCHLLASLILIASLILTLSAAHCTGTCPCPCRKCLKRTGRHRLCDWCPSSWCRWTPINHPMQMRSPMRKNLPRHLLEEPMKLSDKYWIVVFVQYCSMLYTSTWSFHSVIVINNCFDNLMQY